MANRRLNRREALKLGAKYTAGAVFGASLFPSVLSGRNLRHSIREFNIVDYGAVGDGEAISFTAIPRTHNTVVGSIHDIKLTNITGETENSVRINGTPESRISDIELDNVHMTMNRHTNYPGGLFDNRPTDAYPDIEIHDNPGYSIRFADEISLRNCSVEWGDNRPDYYTHVLEAENVTGLRLTDFEGEAAHPDRYASIAIH